MNAPDDDCIARGTKYVCKISREADGHSGVVADEKDFVLWRYGNRKNAIDWSGGNPLNKPDFVFIDEKTKSEIIIRRISLFPSCFDIIQENHRVGSVRMESPLRNQYGLITKEGRRSQFRMPLFTVYFWGGTDEGAGLGGSRAVEDGVEHPDAARSR